MFGGSAIFAGSSRFFVVGGTISEEFLKEKYLFEIDNVGFHTWHICCNKLFWLHFLVKYIISIEKRSNDAHKTFSFVHFIKCFIILLTIMGQTSYLVLREMFLLGNSSYLLSPYLYCALHDKIQRVEGRKGGQLKGRSLISFRND